MQTENFFDDVSSVTDNILDRIMVRSAASTDSLRGVTVPSDFCERLLNCKRNFPKPESIVSIDVWSQVFKDILGEPE